MSIRHAVCILALLSAGCASPYFKAVEGTSTSIGVTLPNEEVMELEALHYLNGQKVVVKEPSEVAYFCENCQSNSYFGVVRTASWRKSEVRLRPASTNAVGEVWR